ncbi:hypothetical protein PSGE105469_17235 [Pseudomonas gessardii]
MGRTFLQNPGLGQGRHREWQGALPRRALYSETPASIAKRENAAAMRKAGALGMSTDGKPSKKQRRDLFKFRGSGNDD